MLVNKLGRAVAVAAGLTMLTACVSLAAATPAIPAARTSDFGPFAPANPYVAPGSASTMHANAESSGTTLGPGPSIGGKVTVTTLAAACPTVLDGSDGMPVALCTAIIGKNPTVFLLNPSDGAPLASLKLPAGNLFGGVYAYLDPQNQIVLFDSGGNLLRIGHHLVSGRWGLSIDSSIPAGATIDKLCSDVCGGVVGISPDWSGRVWFATMDGAAGFVDPKTGAVHALKLGTNEQVANSISTGPAGTVVATTYAIYLLRAVHGEPRIIWRYPYNRGSARKPGQLSYGTGSTPVLFGGAGGARYVAFTDNARPAENLIVLDTRTPYSSRSSTNLDLAKPHVDCKIPVLTPGPSGTENAPIATGSSVFVASTYGYPYPAYPTGAPASQPSTAPFTGGVTRVDLNASGHGCHIAWLNKVRSAAVPRLDVPRNILYTTQRTDPLDPTGTSDIDSYRLVAIDASTGAVEFTKALGTAYLADTLQLSPTIAPNGVLYQGTISGIDQVAPH